MDITNTSPDDWIFQARGNANILFRYNGPDHSLKRNLLRLRMRKDPKTYIPTVKVRDLMDKLKRTLFAGLVVDCKLVKLNSQLIKSLSTQEHELMVGEEYGLLLPNLLYGYNQRYRFSKHCTLHTREIDALVQSVILELKPKWLYDNQANYCRNCLLSQLKGMKRHFCPLDLLHQSTIPRGVCDMLSECPESARDCLNQSGFPLENILVTYFQSPANVLSKLKEQQDALEDGTDLANVTSENQVLDELALRMTLRDVGIFLLIDRVSVDGANGSTLGEGTVDVAGNGSFSVRAKLYDLDLKPKSRHSHWAHTERKLRSHYYSTKPGWSYCVKSGDISASTS